MNGGLDRKGEDRMKKLVILLAVLLIMTMLPTAYAGKGNTVSPEWYYNDPEGTAYPLGVNDPQYRYDQPPYYSSYTYYPSTVEERLAASVERIGYLGYRTLRKTSPYMRGSDVKTLQMMLNTLGYFAGKVDGIFGSKTKAAVQRFQRHNGLTADGVVGPVTRNRLLTKYKNRTN